MTKECQMIRRGLFFSFLFLSFFAFAEDEPAEIVRFKLTPSIRDYLKQNEFDITGVNYNTNEIEAVLTKSDLDKIKNQKADIQFSFPQTLAAAPDSLYKNPDEIEAYLQDVHHRFPELTELKSIGQSLEGRNIWALKITSPHLDVQKPVLFINGMHHAREVMTPEIAIDMIDYLTLNYQSDAKVTKWLDSTIVWIVPMFNVDGNFKMWTKDSMWRKNTRNDHGVDINRNYPYAWNKCSGSSDRPWAQDFRGEAPGSEPETQAMMKFVASIKPVFSISYHSYSEIVIYPFGCEPLRTPESDAVEKIGAEIAKKLQYKPGTSWELLYNVDGGDIDWLYSEHQVIPYVIEVNSTNQGFQPDYLKWRDATVNRNRPGWMHLLDRFEGPSLYGKVSLDEYTNIKIARSGEQVPFKNYKINPDGSFYIILNNGNYDLSFEGNKTKQFSSVSVTSKKLINF
jgi:carboxypeptidase T